MTHIYGSCFQVRFGWLFLSQITFVILCKLSTMSIYYSHLGKLNKNRVTAEHVYISSLDHG